MFIISAITVSYETAMTRDIDTALLRAFVAEADRVDTIRDGVLSRRRQVA